MSNVIEFEVNKLSLVRLLSQYVGKGIHEGDNWWISTTDKKTVKLVVKEKPLIKKMDKAERELRKEISLEIENRLRWDNAPLQIRGAINKTVEAAADIAKGAK